MIGHTQLYHENLGWSNPGWDEINPKPLPGRNRQITAVNG